MRPQPPLRRARHSLGPADGAGPAVVRAAPPIPTPGQLPTRPRSQPRPGVMPLVRSTQYAGPRSDRPRAVCRPGAPGYGPHLPYAGPCSLTAPVCGPAVRPPGGMLFRPHAANRPGEYSPDPADPAPRYSVSTHRPPGHSVRRRATPTRGHNSSSRPGWSLRLPRRSSFGTAPRSSTTGNTPLGLTAQIAGPAANPAPRPESDRRHLLRPLSSIRRATPTRPRSLYQPGAFTPGPEPDHAGTSVLGIVADHAGVLLLGLG
jgi:hypothetical protein